MYLNPGTMWACPITIPFHEQLTITVPALFANTLRQYNNKRRKIAQIYFSQKSTPNQSNVKITRKSTSGKVVTGNITTKKKKTGKPQAN